MRRDFSLQAFSAGLLAAFVGYASSFAVVVQGLTAVGASRAESTSGLAALAIAMGICAIWLSARSRLPISIAWSTPGAALLASTGPVPGGFAAAVGAFLVVGVAIVAAGVWRRPARWVAAIPAPLANAMLAGVLLSLCLAPVRAVAVLPALALPVVVIWAVMARFYRLFAVPVAALTMLAVTFATTRLDTITLGTMWPTPVLVMPVFTLHAMIGIALPLFIVTMASQNVPGLAVLRANGFSPPAGRLFTTTGVFTLLSAPFGGHSVNLAAITAALCAGTDAHPDPGRRYWAAIVAGGFYIAFGLASGGAIAFVNLAPPILIQAVAGLALLGAFGSAMLAAVAEAADREAAMVTFLVSASGITLFGVGGAFWGLVAGGALLALSRWRPAVPG